MLAQIRDETARYTASRAADADACVMVPAKMMQSSSATSAASSNRIEATFFTACPSLFIGQDFFAEQDVERNVRKLCDCEEL